MSSYNYEVINEEFKANRFGIAHTEQEIGAIIQTSVFCVDKICFPRPGHIYYNTEKVFMKIVLKSFLLC